jgi:peptide/nickel transport system substrate-binding protein
VDEVDWKFLSDPVERYESLVTGETNIIYDVPTVDWQSAKQQFQVTQYITPGKPVSLYLNTEEGVFTDVRLRQAFAYGADRKAAVQAAFHNVVPYEGNPSVSQATPGYDSSVADAYPYDPSKAEALLAAAGYTTRDAAGYLTKDGKELDVRLPYPAGSVITSEGVTLLEILQQEWKQIGFNVKLIPTTQAQTFSGAFSTPDSYDAQPWYWTSPSAAILWIVWRPSTKSDPNYSNSSFYNNDTLSGLIQEGNSAATTASADAAYGQAQQLIQDQAAAVGLYTQTSSIAVAKNLHDVWLEASQGEPVFEDAYFTK